MSEPWAINAGKASTAIGTATIESDDNLLTITDHGLGDGDTVTVDTLTGGGSALTADAVYFVRDATTDDFALALTLHGPQVEFNTDGGADVYHFAPQYNAAQLRRLNAGLMFGGTSDAFGVRQGVRPGHVPLSVSGTTWTVEDLTGAVYPGLSSDDGGYPVAHQSESGSLDPADGSNDRIDALDLQIQDDDADASGFRRARVVYVAGTPAADPSAPAVTSNALRLGTILVSSGGSPSPSIDTLAVWTVASGGVLPVRDSTELPAAGLYDGMAVFQQDTEAFRVDDGTGAWGTVGNRQGYQFGGRVIFTSSDTFDKGDYPGLRAVDVQVQAGGGAGGGAPATGSGESSAGAGGEGGGYARSFILASSLGASETVTVGPGGTGASGADGGNGGTSSFTNAGGTNVSAAGGAGGVSTAAASSDASRSGAASVQSISGDIQVDGGGGGPAMRLGGGAAASSGGSGGEAVLGKGGRASGAGGAATGGPGRGFGGGGGGACANANDSALSGADGSDGIVIVSLFY